jgi:hypothetical protein
MLDLDVPLNGGTTLLHWLVPDVVPNASNGQLTIPNTTDTPGAPYFGPAPPPGNAHRYVELLFDQPENFEIPADFASINPPKNVTDRIGFDLEKFVEESGLKKLVAGNFFRVQNTTTTASGTGASAQVSETAASSASQTGAAGASQTAVASRTGAGQSASGTASATDSSATGAGVRGYVAGSAVAVCGVLSAVVVML